MVVDHADVFEQDVTGLSEQPTEQAGVSGDSLLTDDQGSGVRHVVGGEIAPVAVEGDALPQPERPLGAVSLGDFPFGGEARLQRSVEAVGVNQGLSERAHLRVGGGGGAQPAAYQFLHGRRYRDAKSAADYFRLLHGRRCVGRARRSGGYDGGRRSGRLLLLLLSGGLLLRGRGLSGGRLRRGGLLLLSGRCSLLRRRGCGVFRRSSASDADHQEQRCCDG